MEGRAQHQPFQVLDLSADLISMQLGKAAIESEPAAAPTLDTSALSERQRRTAQRLALSGAPIPVYQGTKRGTPNQGHSRMPSNEADDTDDEGERGCDTCAPYSEGPQSASQRLLCAAAAARQ